MKQDRAKFVAGSVLNSPSAEQHECVAREVVFTLHRSLTFSEDKPVALEIVRRTLQNTFAALRPCRGCPPLHRMKLDINTQKLVLDFEFDLNLRLDVFYDSVSSAHRSADSVRRNLPSCAIYEDTEGWIARRPWIMNRSLRNGITSMP